MAMDGLRINQSNREFRSRYTIIIDIRELTLSFLYATGTGMVIFLFFFNHNEVTIGHLTQQQLTTRSQQT